MVYTACTRNTNSIALGKLGYIVAETFVILDVSSNVPLFAHPWKHCCGNKISFPGSKNISYQIQKHLMFPYVSHCFLVFAHSGKHGETLVGKCFRNNVSWFALGLSFWRP
jgi:hypothetical protein